MQQQTSFISGLVRSIENEAEHWQLIEVCFVNAQGRNSFIFEIVALAELEEKDDGFETSF